MSITLFKIALQLWPRPETSIVEEPVIQDKGPPAAFDSDCIKLAQQHLGTHLSKLSQPGMKRGDGRIRLMCAVSAIHKESGDFHRAQVNFLDTAQSPYACFGCASSETTLLVPLPVIRGILELIFGLSGLGVSLGGGLIDHLIVGLISGPFVGLIGGLIVGLIGTGSQT